MQDLLKNINSATLKQAYHDLLRDVLGHVDVVRRLEKAYDILVRSSDYEISHKKFKRKDLIFTVKSSNDTYTVTPSEQSCSCPDAEMLCKHRLAVKLILNALQLQRDETKLVQAQSQHFHKETK